MYGNTGGGASRKHVVQYSGAHQRARKDLKGQPCAQANDSCAGRLEVALRPDAPKEHLYESAEGMYYSGPVTSDGYRILCRSHHAREGSAVQVIARLSPELGAAVYKELFG